MLDPYHCSLRMLSLLTDSAVEHIDWDRLRLLDFLVAFPHTLKSMRVPAELRTWKRSLREISDPYEQLPNLTRLFFQVGEIQAAAIHLLIAGELVDQDSLESDKIVIVEPNGEKRKKLLSATEKLNYRTEDWYKFIVKYLISYPLNGRGGLKERTGLMEYRHDFA